MGSTALGSLTVASGLQGATALGSGATASGNFSATALGNGTEASGDIGATALGNGTEASGDAGATALGQRTVASGSFGATAIGYLTEANGDDGATAIGRSTVANGDNCLVIGRFNETLVNAGQDIIETSPLFIIGNGDAGSANRSNAMVVLKNGNIGIGLNEPTSQIEQSFNSNGDDVHIKLIEQGNDGASITLKNDQNDNFWTVYGKPEVADSTSVINFFFKANEGHGVNGNKFRIFGDGDATLAGILTQNSDRRLKTNISPIKDVLSTIQSINGYTYHWKSDINQSKRQVGVLAQEVQKVLPELIKEDEEGILSVSYSSLIPVLLEAIKEQQEIINSQESRISKLEKERNAINDDYENRINRLESQIERLMNLNK